MKANDNRKAAPHSAPGRSSQPDPGAGAARGASNHGPAPLTALGNQAVQRLLAPPAGTPAASPAAPDDGLKAAAAAASAGSGRPLPGAMRNAAEGSTGLPLGSVRLHYGSAAGALAARSRADALTWRNHVFVRPERWAPDTQAGRALLGHELVHAAQNQAFGTGQLRRLSRHDDAAEREAHALGPRVLEGEHGTARPGSRQAAAIGRQETGAQGTLATPASGDGVSASMLPAAVSTTSAPPTSSSATPTPSTPAAFDPATADARTLTNADLIARDLEATTFLARATATSPQTAGWQQLQRAIAAERTLRIARGFVFLAERSDSSPSALCQMRGGSAPGIIEIVTTNAASAMGMADVTLGGAIMTPRQVRAYVATLGYRTISGPQAEGLIANRADLIQRAITAERQRGLSLPVQSGIGRTPFLDYRLAGGFRPYGPGTAPGQLPLDLTDTNFRGRVGEIGMGSDWRTGWGTGLQDLNRVPWVDVSGRTQSGNFPVVDFGPGAGRIPRILDIQPISVTTSGSADYDTRQRQYTAKLEALLDVAGRRTSAPAGTDPVLQHLRQASGNAALAPGTPAYQQAQARFLSDTMFAVPDADLAMLRGAIANPNAAPPGGTNRMITRGGGYRALYTEALLASPVQLTLRDGSTVTCSSLAELAARAPTASTFTVAGSTLTYPPNQRISAAQFNLAMTELGRTAASRIVPIGSAPAMAAAADVVRTPAGGPTIATPTRILEIDSRELGYIGERIGQGLADPRTPGAPGSGGTRWTTAAQSDPMLSAVRAMTGNPTLQRGTPEFEAARQQALGNAMLAINADDVRAFQATLRSDAAWEGGLRASFGAAMADNPVTVTTASGQRTFRSPAELDAARASMTPEQYNLARAQAQGLVTGRVTGSGVTTAQLNRLEGFRDVATASLGDRAGTVLQPDVLSHVRLGSTRATAESFGRGGLGGMVIGVVTTAGTIYVDTQEHPDWAQELALAGGRDFAVSGTQSALESRLTYYMAQRAIATGTPLSGLGRFGARAGPAALFAGGMEAYNISQEQRPHSGLEVTTRVGRAVGIAIISMEIGAAAGSVVPGAGTIAGAVVGFIVGAIAGGVSAYILEQAVPGGAESWNAEAAAEDARRAREAEALRQAMAPRVVSTLGTTTTLDPVMSSADISTEEQQAIARWITLLTMARREPPPAAGRTP
ncbi:eCIS core domain-containing protein [Cupriavidus oxalaticus]|uniref:eCIS core domain-containing protein n=1 Tax=Cupriavidus oxalaticus TaxID=96344 RepID=UPI003172F82E